MTALFVALTLHVLCWGAVGAAIGPRAGLGAWAAAPLCVLLPGLAAAVLAVLALLPRTARPQPRAPEGWRRACWAGVAAGLLIVAAAWLPWVLVEVHGQLGSVRDHIVALDSGQWDVLPVLGTVLGGLVAAFAVLAMRTGSREWLAGSALAAAVPATLGASAVLSDDLLSSTLRHLNSVGGVLAEQGVREVSFAGRYELGVGPALALAGGVLALGWSLAAGLRRFPVPGPQLPSESPRQAPVDRVPAWDPNDQAGPSAGLGEAENPEWDQWGGDQWGGDQWGGRPGGAQRTW